jgi:sulfur carrier protein
MRFNLNNREEVTDIENLTVGEMLVMKKYSFRMRIIKINGELISRENYDTTPIHDGDNVQLVYLMSGG